MEIITASTQENIFISLRAVTFTCKIRWFYMEWNSVKLAALRNTDKQPRKESSVSDRNQNIGHIFY